MRNGTIERPDGALAVEKTNTGFEPCLGKGLARKENPMGLIQELGKGQGYLKGGFLGFAKSGKTYTAVELACGLRNHLAEHGGNAGRIVFFDTENGSEYVAPLVAKKTGQKLLGVKARSFADLMALTTELRDDDILLVDSITHPWRELCESHLARINEALRKNNKRPRLKLEFQDWNVLKQTWEKWATWYLNSRVHVIICGRAGFEYEMEENEETGKKELIKSGVKMKTESEFGFEPSLLVEMERIQTTDRNGHIRLVRRATILGDRFALMDGAIIDNPTFKDFLPHVESLMPGVSTPIDTALKTDTGVNEDGEAEWTAERRKRTILAEEIQGLLVAKIPGQAAADKKRKADLMHQAFDTRSWTAIEALPSARLKSGLSYLRKLLEESALPIFGSKEEPVDWPDSFDGPELIWNGKHLKFSEETGNYQEVSAKAA